MRRAAYLDRDGVICVNRPDYVRTVSDFEFLPGALDALAALSVLPVKILVVSNQSGVGRGVMSADALWRINAHMLAEVARVGARIDGVYYCVHAPDADCQCRKPRIGLLTRAAKAHGVTDPRGCWMVGDSYEDVRAGLSFGARPLLVRTGRGDDALGKLDGTERKAVRVVADLAEAVKEIGGEL